MVVMGDIIFCLAKGPKPVTHRCSEIGALLSQIQETLEIANEGIVGIGMQMSGSKKMPPELKVYNLYQGHPAPRRYNFFGGGEVAKPVHDNFAIIEVKVDDVQHDYNATISWGNESLLFRDPDGNLVKLATPIMPEAIDLFARNISEAANDGLRKG